MAMNGDESRGFASVLAADLDRPRLASSESAAEETEVTIRLEQTDTNGSVGYAFLKAVVLNESMSNGDRMRAAIAIVPYEVGKRSVVAGGANRDLARNIEDARRRQMMERSLRAQRERLHSLPATAAMDDGNDAA